MLKIKDNIELKELEKFGFKVLKANDNEMEYGCDGFWDILAYKDVGQHYSIVICNDEYLRQIDIVATGKYPLQCCVNWHLDIIYDLIKADLVEKVDD